MEARVGLVATAGIAVIVRLAQRAACVPSRMTSAHLVRAATALRALAYQTPTGVHARHSGQVRVARMTSTNALITSSIAAYGVVKSAQTPLVRTSAHVAMD